MGIFQWVEKCCGEGWGLIINGLCFIIDRLPDRRKREKPNRKT
jgi:hypothetical protein